MSSSKLEGDTTKMSKLSLLLPVSAVLTCFYNIRSGNPFTWNWKSSRRLALSVTVCAMIFSKPNVATYSNAWNENYSYLIIRVSPAFQPCAGWEISPPDLKVVTPGRMWKEGASGTRRTRLSSCDLIEVSSPETPADCGLDATFA